MKKILSVFFALCLCMAASAQQHMKFMGIPLDGTIDNFAMKLKQKYTGNVDWYLYNLSVLPEAQGKGIASRLLRPMLDFL